MIRFQPSSVKDAISWVMSAVLSCQLFPRMRRVGKRGVAPRERLKDRLDSVQPEVSFLAECARVQRIERPAAHIRWEVFEGLVAYHLLTLPVHDALSQWSRDRSIGDLSGIGVASRLALKQNLLLTARLAQLIGDFATAGIPALTLKGPALAEYLYQDIGRRQFLDLDLLIEPGDVHRAVGVLGRRGYTLQSGLGWLKPDTLVERCNELTFCGACDTVVDLHWEMSSDDRPFRIPTSRLLASATTVEIAGRDIPVLGPACLLVYLCIHGAGHCWSRLQWLCDVARLLTIAKDLNWDDVFEIASEARANHVLALGLRLVHEVLDAELPPAVLQWAQNDRVVRPLARRVIERLHSDRPTPPSSLELTMFNARLAESRWDSVRHIAALLKAPTEADAELIRLPESLLFLYYPLRVARLAAKYSRTLLLPRSAA